MVNGLGVVDGIGVVEVDVAAGVAVVTPIAPSMLEKSNPASPALEVGGGTPNMGKPGGIPDPRSGALPLPPI